MISGFAKFYLIQVKFLKIECLGIRQVTAIVAAIPHGANLASGQSGMRLTLPPPFSSIRFKDFTMSTPKATTPFVTGLIAGASIIVVLGFSNGWVVTAEANSSQVKDAWVGAQAAVCVSLAEAHLKATKSTVSLDGYQTDANKARDDLANTFAVVLPGEKTAESIVITACARKLNKSKV